jgi:hypothetical protein
MQFGGQQRRGHLPSPRLAKELFSVKIGNISGWETGVAGRSLVPEVGARERPSTQFPAADYTMV